MTTDAKGRWYNGRGQQDADAKWQTLPDVDPDALKRPDRYLASSGLVAAVNVALELGMPLLLTGEPGCGKSRLAHSLAWELGIPDPEPVPESDPQPRPLRFTVKSDTDSRDLFYRFDTLGRFHAAQCGNGVAAGDGANPAIVQHRDEVPGQTTDPRRFVTYHALGKAILLAHGARRLADRYPGLLLPDQLARLPAEPQRAVVLIDEIDKAPREVPNDILNEIEDMSFEVPELFGHFSGPIALPPRIKDEPGERTGDRVLRPIVIITSNAERELPEAFLRRCVYYHVDLPPFTADLAGGDTSIEAIVATRLHDRFEDDTPFREDALAFFRYLRDPATPLRGKRPSLAEFLSWLYYLGLGTDPLPARLAAHPRFDSSLAILLKHKDDLAEAGPLCDGWDRSPKTPR